MAEIGRGRDSPDNIKANKGDNITFKDGGDSPDNVKANKGGTAKSYTLDRLARASVKMSTLDRPLIDGKKVPRRRPDSRFCTVEASLHPHPATRRSSLTTSVILLYVNV